jgi:hypothetical protein
VLEVGVICLSLSISCAFPSPPFISKDPAGIVRVIRCLPLPCNFKRTATILLMAHVLYIETTRFPRTAGSRELPSRVDNVHCYGHAVPCAACRLVYLRLATRHNYNFADWGQQNFASRVSVILLMHLKPRVMLYLDQINDASGNFMFALCCCILGCVLL